MGEEKVNKSINPLNIMRMKKVLFLFGLAFTCVMLQAQTVVYSDNFDSYTAGQRLCSQNNTNWTTWSNTPGSSEDAYISNEQASSPSNSLKITGTNDIIYRFSNQTSGVFDIDFNYYVPSSGSGAYFNLQHYYNPGVEWAFECFLYNSGTGYITINNANTNFSFPSNAWFPVKIHVDLDNNSASLTVNGNSVISWTFSNTSENTNGICQLGSVNFYAGAPDNASGTYYVDDFVFTEISAANDGSFVFSPDGDINVSVGPNLPSTTSYTLNLSNPGGTPVNYRIVPVYDVEPSVGQLTNTLTRAGEVSENGILFGSTFVAAAIGFPASDLISQNLIGMTLRTIHVTLSNVDLMLNPKIQIYDMNGILVDGPGEVIYEQAFTPVEGENIVSLNTPYTLDGRDLWFGVYFEQTEETAASDTRPVVGCDDAVSPDPYGNWCKTSVAWGHLNAGASSSLTYNWAISGYVDGAPITPWMSVAPTAQGSIAANGSAQAIVNFTIDNQLPHTGKLYVYSDDLNNDLNILNVTVSITNSVEESESILISIYPNPATDVLNIASENINRVEVFNLAGQRIWEGQYCESDITIHTQGWAPGTYLVKVTAQGATKVEKVIVK